MYIDEQIGTLEAEKFALQAELQQALTLKARRITPKLMESATKECDALIRKQDLIRVQPRYV